MTDRRQLVLDNLHLAEWLARKCWGRRRGAPDQLADLIQHAHRGLLDAAERYDPSRGVKFATMAVWWVRRRVWEAVAAWERVPLPLEDPELIVDDAPSPEEEAESAEVTERVRAAVATLPAREAEVIRLRHFEGLTLDEVGRAWGVTRERVRQVQLSAEERLRGRLCADV